MQSAHNENYLFSQDQVERAEGRLYPEKEVLSGRKKLPVDGIRQSGGLRIDQTKYFDEETLLVRFGRLQTNGSTSTKEQHMDTPWWLTQDMFRWLMGRAHASNRGVMTLVREQLLLPPEWNDADCFVQAYPKPGIQLAAWFGPPRTVQPEESGLSSRWIAPQELPETWMYQIYIPGLGVRGAGNALKWMEFEGLYSTQLAPNGNGQPHYPRLMPGRRHGP